MKISRRLLAECLDIVSDVGPRIWSVRETRVAIVAPVNGTVDPREQVGKAGHLADLGKSADGVLKSCHLVQNVRSRPSHRGDDDLDRVHTGQLRIDEPRRGRQRARVTEGADKVCFDVDPGDAED